MVDTRSQAASSVEQRAAAETPREMSRDERRIINDKLDEVYGKDAYKAPWTDAAVAKDLGVPRDWVAQVRDQFFGVEGSNPQFDEFLLARDRVEGQIKGLSARYDAAVKAFGDYRTEFKEVQDQRSALQQLGKRIEREIGR